ncbi:MAG: GNAT family N-acetyltransferase [Flavobacteriaceae bacterium]|nr:GNAT family N-acetyltransferase [Flavobacteriaceae bacterium]
MKIRVRKFNELSTSELYQVLQLRSAVFVVEQQCIYQDVDGKDHKAYHVMVEIDGKLVGYTRIFEPGDYFENTSIGRVVVQKDKRGLGLGVDLMQASITYIETELQQGVIELSAQTYLKRFYNDLGFQVVGEGYLEDGIPHIKMIRETSISA